MEVIKNVIIIVLLVVSIGLGYMLMVIFPQRAATECEAECTEKILTQVIPQATAAAEAECAKVVEAQVLIAVQQCQQALQQIMQIPECASALAQ